MNLSNIKILILFFLLVQTKIVSAQDCKADIQIRTDIDNAQIILNDSLVGEGKYVNIQIEKGKYSIVILENSDRWNAKTFSDSLLISDCRNVELNYNFQSDLLLQTVPQDVYVFQDDSLIGFTPLFLTQGTGEILLKKDGYADKTLSLSDLENNPTVKLDFTGIQKTESFVSTIWFKFLIGSLVALGATTAYYKLEADDAFTEYQITGDPELLEQTDKYDLISGVSFVMLQINFALIAYFFLTGF